MESAQGLEESRHGRASCDDRYTQRTREERLKEKHFRYEEKRRRVREAKELIGSKHF